MAFVILMYNFVILIFPISSLIYFPAFFTNLTVQYSVFGSILTAGGIVGALVNGKLADVIGRRGVRFFGHPF